MRICASREDPLILGTTPKMGEIGSGPTLLEVLIEFDGGDKLGFSFLAIGGDGATQLH